MNKIEAKRFWERMNGLYGRLGYAGWESNFPFDENWELWGSGLRRFKPKQIAGALKA